MRATSPLRPRLASTHARSQALDIELEVGELNAEEHQQRKAELERLAAEPPAPLSNTMSKLLGATLENLNGGVDEHLADQRFVALYFSAHW